MSGLHRCLENMSCVDGANVAAALRGQGLGALLDTDSIARWALAIAPRTASPSVSDDYEDADSSELSQPPTSAAARAFLRSSEFTERRASGAANAKAPRAASAALTNFLSARELAGREIEQRLADLTIGTTSATATAALQASTASGDESGQSDGK